MARTLACEDENLVDYFIITTKRFDGSTAQLSFVYPPLDDDHDETDFCENVTMFTFPHGYVHSWDGRSLPPPPAHNVFTLTDPQGDHLYGASISFFETSSHVKSLCVLTRRPFYTQMLRYLEQLLLLGLHQARAFHGGGGDAVERALCNLFHEVPVPYRGLSVQMQVGDLEILLERPPFLDFPFEGDAELMLYAFMMIDAKVLQQLYHHVLLEHRVLIVGNDSVLVTAVVETLKGLIFPLTWLHVVIPNIPDSLDLSTLLDAPVPFLAGAHTGQLQHVAIPSNVVKYDLSESRLVVPSASNNHHHHQYQQDLENVVLPPLPETSNRLLHKLSTTRLADLHKQKKELHQKLWDRRIQLQKCCLATSSSSGSVPGRAPVITPKQFFLVKQNLVYRKMMKLYLEVMASMLQDFPQSLSHHSRQFDADKFIDKKPSNTRTFYRAFTETAQFQSFLAQHSEYMDGLLPLEDAAKFQFVHQTLLGVERVTGNQADSSRAVAMALTKTFVAHMPQDSTAPDPARENGEHETKSRVEAVEFPAVKLEAFGEPRQIVFPSMSADAVHSSLGTFISPSNVAASRRASKDTSDWMQSFMRTVPLPSALSSPLSLSRSNNNCSSSSHHERSLLSIFGSSSTTSPSPLVLPLQAPFKRSRTIDRLKKATPFYRTMTQKALDSTLSSLASAAANVATTATPSPPPAPTRPATVVRSIWFITTSSCSCRDRIVLLTHTLVEQLQTYGSKTSPHVVTAYCELIHALATCGHPSEAKAVFEECISGSALLSLAPIAGMPHFWKPFSALLQCYIMNGLVQRAFDLLVQVQLEEEQLLDPSLGVLQFTAQVLGADTEAMVERVYVTFSCGNLGMRLAPRKARADSASSSFGCELIAFESDTAEDMDGKLPLQTETALERASGLHVHDIVETINGELVLHHPFEEIVTALKQASRPMTVTFVRGLDRLSMLTTGAAGEPPRRSSSSASATSVCSTSVVVDGRSSSSSSSSSKGSPRRDLCDRFGLLPQRGIRLMTLADCECCGTRLTLSQVQIGWSPSDPNDYTTKCPACGHRFVPRLCVMLGVMTTMYQPSVRVGSAAARTQLPPDAKVEQFEYLSLPVIRKELSNLANKVPLTLLPMKDLRERNPRIYWNIVVKLLSLEVPLNFMELPDATTSNATKETKADVKAPPSEKPTTLDGDDQEMRAIRDLVVKRAERLKSESSAPQRIEDVLSSVLKALGQQTKEVLHAKSVKVPSTLPGHKRWSLLGSVTTASLNLRAANAADTTKTRPVLLPSQLARGHSNGDDEASGYDDRHRSSSDDERETDVEDMRSSCTISVTDSAVLDDLPQPAGDVTAKMTKPSRVSSKFSMPSLPSAPFQRTSRAFPSAR